VARGSCWSEAVGGVRAFSRGAIAAAVGRWSAQSAAIVSAIVIGDRAGLDDAVQRSLQEAGTYHVIAISGGNIAILAGLMLGAFRIAGWLGRAAMLASIVVLVVYAALVGGGASVDRATLMAVVYFAGRALDQRSPPLNTLWVVAAILEAAAPLSVTDPAFALTFGATFSILLVGPLVLVSDRPRLVQAAATLLAASVAAEAALFPVSALVFSRITFAGLALNFLAIPLMAVAQIAGMAVVPIALVSSRLAALCGLFAHIGAAGLVWSAGLVRFAPALTYRVAAPPLWAVGLYYGGAMVSWILWTRMRQARLAAAGVALAGAVWILGEPWAWWAARGDGRLHVTFIDVGQGDSMVLRFPRGSTLLVDTGGLTFGSGFDVGDRVVGPVLRQMGIRRLGRVALTHGDPDHIGGAPSVLREFRPSEVWEGIPVPRFAPLNALRVEAEAMDARWTNVYRGDEVWIDGVEVRAESPTPGDWERQRVRNDDSLVLEVRWRDVSILLTGDIGKAIERGLTIAPSPLRVLKVPHHGSRTSSSVEFVRALRPQAVVFSVGRSNHFGHPAPDVLQRYRDVGAAIFRTDQDGAVMLDTDGRSIDVHTFTGRQLELSSAMVPSSIRPLPLS
jgi:competence protein ComEC